MLRSAKHNHAIRLILFAHAEPVTVDSEGQREVALSRLLPLRISLSALQARSRRVSVLLDEILESEEYAFAARSVALPVDGSHVTLI